MKKVCQVTSGYFRIDARVFQRQSKSLKKNGYDVVHILNDNEKEEAIDGIRFKKTHLNTDKRALILIIATFQFLPNCLKENADLYILHSPELLPLGILLKLLGKKVVYDAHEDLPRHILEKETVPKILRKPLSRLSEVFLMICFRLFNGIISPHKHIISTLISKNITSELIANFPLVRTLSKIEKEEFLKRRSSLCY